MPAPTQEGDIALNDVIVLRDPVGQPATSGYLAWVEDFNPQPAVNMATNDVPLTYAAGIRPGGDMPLDRRWLFELWGWWADNAGLLALQADLATATAPLLAGTATLSYQLGGVVWTATGRYEPASMVRTELMLAHQVGSWQVRFRATDPVIAGSGAQTLL
ncbi:MAG: hypothetical protein OEV62_00135 [Actinomycetota bacterium]|nr:hypothetical protein [Actinomycetota bacterium]